MTDWISQLPIGKTMRELETTFFLETLKFNKGNRLHTAKMLGWSLRTVRIRIQKYQQAGLHVMASTSTGGNCK
jgi:DNA-binding NtrC family response regulator